MARAFTWFVRLVMLLFVTQLVAIVAAVVVSSFGTHWLGTWLPEGFTTSWFTSAWSEFDLFDVVVVTLKVAITVVFISLVLGVPAAYALARQNRRTDRSQSGSCRTRVRCGNVVALPAHSRPDARSGIARGGRARARSHGRYV